MRRIQLSRMLLGAAGLSILGAGCEPLPSDTETEPGTTTTVTTTMRIPECGDGFLDPEEGEGCDDGNLEPGDGCSPECQITGCGDGVLQDGEECDDGNTDPSDLCTDQCTNAVCGDGDVLAGVELCDGDGCAACSEVLPIEQVTGYCARLFDGRVKCWGGNGYGMLGLGDKEHRGDDPGEMGEHLPVVELGTGVTAVHLTSGYAHTCALMAGGGLKCWGANGRGQSGGGFVFSVGEAPGEMGDDLAFVDVGTGRHVLSVSAGEAHTCAVLDDNSLKCWGRNDAGQLGLGDEVDRGVLDDDMGDALPALELGTGRSAVQVSAGRDMSCVLLDDGTVKCWGVNLNGALGMGDKTWRGDNPGEMGDTLPPVDLGAGAKAIAVTVNDQSACALMEDQALKCWGDGAAGVSGYVGDEAADMGDALVPVYLGKGRSVLQFAQGTLPCVVADDGTGHCHWGGEFDQLPFGEGVTLTSLFIGYPRNGATLGDGTLKCWGNNNVGQLGMGDTESRSLSPDLPIVHLYDDRW
jgi:cysteine-rich repeat protein